jgi:hypothetical protein
MSFTAEGTIEIDIADFWEWVHENYTPCKGAEHQYGVPRVNKSNQTLEIDFAMGTDCNPKDWFEKPSVFKQWDELQ